MKSRIVHGSNGFLSSVEDLFRQKERLQEIPRIQRFAARPSLRELFSESLSDPEVVMKAYLYYHYTLKEIGNYLGMHYATVSRLVKRYKVSVSKRGEDMQKTRPDPSLTPILHVDKRYYNGYNSIKVRLKGNDIHDTNDSPVAEHRTS